MFYLNRWSGEHGLRLSCETWDGDLREIFEEEEPCCSQRHVSTTLEPGRLRKEDQQFEARDLGRGGGGSGHSSTRHLLRMCKAPTSVINTTERGEEEKEEEERE